MQARTCSRRRSTAPHRWAAATAVASGPDGPATCCRAVALSRSCAGLSGAPDLAQWCTSPGSSHRLPVSCTVAEPGALPALRLGRLTVSAAAVLSQLHLDIYALGGLCNDPASMRVSPCLPGSWSCTGQHMQQSCISAGRQPFTLPWRLPVVQPGTGQAATQHYLLHAASHALGASLGYCLQPVGAWPHQSQVPAACQGVLVCCMLSVDD